MHHVIVIMHYEQQIFVGQNSIQIKINTFFYYYPNKDIYSIEIVVIFHWLTKTKSRVGTRNVFVIIFYRYKILFYYYTLTF